MSYFERKIIKKNVRAKILRLLLTFASGSFQVLLYRHKVLESMTPLTAKITERHIYAKSSFLALM